MVHRTPQRLLKSVAKGALEAMVGVGSWPMQAEETWNTISNHQIVSASTTHNGHLTRKIRATRDALVIAEKWSGEGEHLQVKAIKSALEHVGLVVEEGARKRGDSFKKDPTGVHLNLPVWKATLIIPAEQNGGFTGIAEKINHSLGVVANTPPHVATQEARVSQTDRGECSSR